MVDIGCGTGFVVRWLSAFGDLGPDVELAGVDLNAPLAREAQRLADAESLPARFLAADAFAMREPVTVYVSTGTLHHFRGPDLERLFGLHEREGTFAFAHFDFQPSPLAALGAWVFHVARMREPLARHDGVLSAVRAYGGDTLVSAARRGAPGFLSGIYGCTLGPLPLPRAFHCVVGVRPPLRDAFARRLGRRASRLRDLR